MGTIANRRDRRTRLGAPASPGRPLLRRLRIPNPNRPSEPLGQAAARRACVQAICRRISRADDKLQASLQLLALRAIGGAVGP
jgi:hypothetical protein